MLLCELPSIHIVLHCYMQDVIFYEDVRVCHTYSLWIWLRKCTPMNRLFLNGMLYDHRIVYDGLKELDMSHCVKETEIDRNELLSFQIWQRFNEALDESPNLEKCCVWAHIDQKKMGFVGIHEKFQYQLWISLVALYILVQHKHCIWNIN